MRLALCLAIVAAHLAAAPALAEEPELATWREAHAAHPDDPDIAWGYAFALRDAGLLESALARFESIAARWEQLRAGARFEAGLLHYELGRPDEALPAFDAVIEDDAAHGSARLYRALCLQALGRDAEADTELRTLEEIDPELRAEALLLRALARAETGDARTAQALFREVIELDPAADTAARARQLLEPSRTRSPFAAAWYQLGGAIDSNVTLDSGNDAAGISSDQSDALASWGAGLVLQPIRGEQVSLSLGYGYSETGHEELKEFDFQSHLLFGSLGYEGQESTWAVRLDALATDEHLDKERYSRSWLVRPNLLVPVGPTLGVTRLFAEFERRAYHDTPVFTSLVRDGDTYAVGIEQSLTLERLRRSVVIVELEAGRLVTDASRDLLGFRGDHDRRYQRVGLQLHVPVWKRLDATLRVAAGRERYPNASLVDSLTDNGVGTDDPGPRRDVSGEASVALGWAWTHNVRTELRWQGIRQRSNVDVYDYERHLIGIHLVGQHLWD